MAILLSSDEPPASEYLAPTTCPDILIICEHAGCIIPRSLNRLGLDPECALEKQHIAWDIGAKAVAMGMAEQLGAGFIWQNYSRLVIDCNRPPHSATSIPAISDHIPIPGNMALGPDETHARINEIFTPYDDLCRKVMAREDIKLAISLHSFTPVMNNIERPWEISFLFDKGEAYAKDMAAFISEESPHLNIGFNEPYQVSESTDWFVTQHAEPKAIPQVLIEIRNNEIRHDDQIQLWVDRLCKAALSMLKTYR
ncbi:MAG: N-formylglutamate amidohydrolase [Candidatus Puniceispirillales bacterium]